MRRRDPRTGREVVQEKFYDHMATIDRKLWTRICLEMAWFYRKGVEHRPQITMRFTSKLPETRAEWDRVRKEINGLRLKGRDAKVEAAKRARQDYMRNYMRSYRSKDVPARSDSE